jgi:hypothetical protein
MFQKTGDLVRLCQLTSFKVRHLLVHGCRTLLVKLRHLVHELAEVGGKGLVTFPGESFDLSIGTS